MEWFFPSFLFAVFLVYLFFGIFTLRLNSRSTANRLFFAVCLCFAQWALFYSVKHLHTAKENIWLWYDWSSVGAIFHSSFLLHFFLSLTGKTSGYSRLKKIFVPGAVYLPAAVFTFYSITGRMGVDDFTYAYNTWLGVHTLHNPVYTAYNIWYNILIICCFILVLNWKNRTDSEKKKNQAGIMLVYGAVAYGLITMTYAFLSFFSLRYAVPGMVLFLIWIFGIYRAVSRHGFLSITPAAALDGILDSIADAIILTGRDKRISWANPAAHDITGYPAGALLKSSIALS